MVPKLHAKGTSFKGAAAYLLHDKDRASTSERVAWTDARNLAVDDPEQGWRIMAATALDQDRLKASAGVKNTGRKSAKHVLHLTLSWHPDQEPNREEMARAADGAIAALGAGDRQALIVAHDDEDHAHVHILINRVSPEDGRHLSSSKEKLKLSKWAEAYEKETGVYCENRIVNNAMREQGQYVRGEKDQARHIFEAAPRTAANDNDAANDALAQQRAKDHTLSLKGRNLAKLQAEAWRRLEAAHETRKAALERQHARDLEQARTGALEDMRPAWLELNARQRSERETFEALEGSFFGRLGNAVKTARLPAGLDDTQQTGVISRTFRILSDAGERKARFEETKDAERKALEAQQAERVQADKKPLEDAHAQRLAANRAVYLQERNELAKAQEAERARLQSEWRDRTAEREAGFKAIVAETEKRVALERERAQELEREKSDPRSALLERYTRTVEFQKASEPDKARGDDGRTNDKPADPRTDLLSRYARMVDFQKAANERAQEQNNERDRDIADDD